MRTLGQATVDADAMISSNGKPKSFSFGAASDKPGWMRAVWTFENGSAKSFTVPNEDIPYLKAIGEIVGKINGSASTPMGGSMNNVMDKLSLKGAPVVEQIRTIGIMPILIGLTIVVIVGRWVWKKMRRKRRR